VLHLCVLLPDVALDVTHLLGVLRGQLLKEDHALIETLVKRRLLQQLVSEVTEIQ
jgi:hypothetical protein